ncbi:MAG: hypothetical protein U0V70_03590 [Terriglobia bacterium]
MASKATHQALVEEEKVGQMARRIIAYAAAGNEGPSNDGEEGSR